MSGPNTLSEFHYTVTYINAEALRSSDALLRELLFKCGLDRNTDWSGVEAALALIGTKKNRCRHWTLPPGRRWVWRIAGIGSDTCDAGALALLLQMLARVNGELAKQRDACIIWLEPAFRDK